MDILFIGIYSKEAVEQVEWERDRDRDREGVS